MKDTVVLAFSGGLDTSWCVPWLIHEKGAEVITVTVDVGGSDGDALAAQSRRLGAKRHVQVDARRRFYDEVLRFLVMGNVLKGAVYPLCVGAERALQAREVARVARSFGVSRVAHGCTAAGNDQVRFEVALRAAAPGIQVLAPVRDVAPTRDEQLDELRCRGFEMDGRTGSYSVNSGLWGTTIGGRETTDTREPLPEAAWVRTKGAWESAREPTVHHLEFEKGEPVGFDGEATDPVTLIGRIDEAASVHGIGRGMHQGETIIGIKGRVAFEAPAATVLITAHRELEKITLTGSQLRLKEHLALEYAGLVHEGFHMDPTCRDLEAFFLSSQRRVTGQVCLRFRTGFCQVEGVVSPYSLAAASCSVYGEAGGEWTPEDARGFSRLKGLPLALHARAGEQEA